MSSKGAQVQMTASTSEAGAQVILVVGHGSEDRDAVLEFERIVGMCASRVSAPVRHAYLELATPSIGQAIEELYLAGWRQITVVPALLTAGRHFEQDIPGELRRLSGRLPGLRCRYAPLLGERSELRELAVERVSGAKPDGAFALVVVARGSRRPRAVEQVRELAIWLKERTGAADCCACFVSVASPSLESVLVEQGSVGGQPVVVFPWFLCTGVLLRRIHDLVDAARRAGADVRLAPHLGPSARTVQAILEAARLAEELSVS